jgi:hypothetical protein
MLFATYLLLVQVVPYTVTEPMEVVMYPFLTTGSCDFCLDIYYQHFRGLRRVFVNFYDSVCYMDYKNVCAGD